MLDVLIFIYKNYWEKHAAQTMKETDEAVMAHELSQAGFTQQDIVRAVIWVKDLRRSVQQPYYQHDPAAVRVFCEMEREKLSEECLNFLMLLQRSQMISAYERDLIVDRALVLPQDNVSVADIRWITMMVLDDATRQQDYLFVEDAMFNLESRSLQ